MADNGRTYWLKSGLLAFLEKGAVFVFNFGSFWCLVRLMEKPVFGVWIIFSSIFAILEVARAGLIQNALVKFLSQVETEEGYKVVNRASFTINLVLTVLFAALLFGLSGVLAHFYESTILASMLKIYCLTTIVLFPFHQFNYIQQANLDFKGIFWANFAKQGLFFIVVLSFFILQTAPDLILLTQIQLGAAIVGSIVAFWFARPYLRFSAGLDFKWAGELLKYGGFTFGTNLSAMIHKKIDTLMLGGLLTPVAAGLYEICIKVINLVEIPTFSIAAVVFPQSARESAKENENTIKLLYEKAVGAILAVTLPAIVFVLLFSDWIVWVIAGVDYLDAAPLLKLTILYGLFIPFMNQFGTILDSIGKPQINFVFVVIGAVINIVSNYIFITRFGVVGAVYGTLTAYIIIFIINQIVLYRLLNVEFWKAFVYIPFFYKQAFELVREKMGQDAVAAIPKKTVE